MHIQSILGNGRALAIEPHSRGIPTVATNHLMPENALEYSGVCCIFCCRWGVFFLVLPVLATLSARALKLPGPQRVTLTMVTVARNSPIALGVAVVAFPDRPLIALALVLGPLVELPVLAVLSQVLRHRKRRTLD